MFFYFLIPNLNGMPDFKWFPGIKQLIIVFISLLPLIVDYISKMEDINKIMNSNFLVP
jgi:hypothetical protein